MNPLLEHRRPIVLMADDDPDDREVAADAFAVANPNSELRFVKDGQELLDYLRRGDEDGGAERSRPPDVILLDLNMPKVTGAEALSEIKSDPALRAIPVVVFTTSRREEDVLDSYDRGANSYISKPTSFQDLVSAMGAFRRYWFETSELPLHSDQ